VTPLLTYFCILWFARLAVNKHTKFEVSSFTHSRDIQGSQSYKSGSRDVGNAPLYLILHFLAFKPNDQSARQIWSL